MHGMRVYVGGNIGGKARRGLVEDGIKATMVYHGIDAYTIIDASGYWQGMAEHTFILTVIFDSGFNEDAVNDILGDLRISTQQDALLVEPITGAWMFR